MKIRMAATLALMAASTLAIADDRGPAGRPRKKVLVELYTSQGCNSCPSANDFLGQFDKLGFGLDRVVPISFHVDYFNEPWVDPFSDKAYSSREMAYNSVKKRKDLYFTPMMMVDGRYPMLGSNRPEATSSIRKALAERPGVSIDLAMEGSGSERSLKVEVAPLVGQVAGRDLMIGVAVTEGPLSTRVPSGENAGKTLVEPDVVRSFAFKRTKLEGSGRKSFSFPLKLASGSNPARCRVAAFVQDWDEGNVYQADAIPWAPEAGPRAINGGGSGPSRRPASSP